MGQSRLLTQFVAMRRVRAGKLVASIVSWLMDGDGGRFFSFVGMWIRQRIQVRAIKASAEHRPGPAMSRNRSPNHMAKSVRASCTMLKKP